MILVSFCRISNGLSDEINLFWRCSSPLSHVKRISCSSMRSNDDMKYFVTFVLCLYFSEAKFMTEQ